MIAEEEYEREDYAELMESQEDKVRKAIPSIIRTISVNGELVYVGFSDTASSGDKVKLKQLTGNKNWNKKV